MITADEARALFEYRDGALYWKVVRKGTKGLGTIAGGDRGDGYWTICANYKHYLRHRLVFLIHHDYMPKYLDHINRMKGDDRIENLREATSSQNKYNTNKYDRARGYYASRGRFHVQIKINGVQTFLGYRDTEEEARTLYLSAREIYHIT